MCKGKRKRRNSLPTGQDKNKAQRRQWANLIYPQVFLSVLWQLIDNGTTVGGRPRLRLLEVASMRGLLIAYTVKVASGGGCQEPGTRPGRTSSPQARRAQVILIWEQGIISGTTNSSAQRFFRYLFFTRMLSQGSTVRSPSPECRRLTRNMTDGFLNSTRRISLPPIDMHWNTHGFTGQYNRGILTLRQECIGNKNKGEVNVDQSNRWEEWTIDCVKNYN